MNLNPKIEKKPPLKLVGHNKRMSVSKDRTKELWQGFIPHRKEIKNAIGTELYSISIFPKDYFSEFNPTTIFEKWAAVAVNSKKAQKGMETLVVPEGLCAIFSYKGLPNDAIYMLGQIFRTWIPRSKFIVDSRPHLAVMGKKYKNDDPNSEEEFWIPVVNKQSVI